MAQKLHCITFKYESILKPIYKFETFTNTGVKHKETSADFVSKLLQPSSPPAMKMHYESADLPQCS